MTQARRMNVLIVMMDDVPQDIWTNTAGLPQLIGGYGGNWLSFPNATLNLPSCGPSRATTFSGQRAAHTGVYYTTIGGANTGADFRWSSTIWREMRRAGYAVAGFGKLMNGYSVNPQRLPGGFTHFSFMDSPGYYSYTITENGVQTAYGTAAGDYSTDVYATKVAAWLTAQANSPDPWCLYWAPNCPHADGAIGPEPAPRHASLSVTLTKGADFNEADVSDKPAWLRAYRPNQLDAAKVAELDGEHINAIRALKSLDEAMVTIIDLLTSTGQLDNTVIMLWGDNVHNYGAHRLAGKGVPYECATNMMLRVRWPGATPGTRTQLVSNIDIAPTLAEIAGVSLPWAVDGMSFVPVLDNASTPYRRVALTEYYGNDEDGPSFYRGRWVDRTVTQYTAEGFGRGDVEAYNLTTDPLELSATAPSAADLAELQKLIALR